MLDEAEGMFRRLSGRIVIPVRGWMGTLPVYMVEQSMAMPKTGIAVGSLEARCAGLTWRRMPSHGPDAPS